MDNETKICSKCGIEKLNSEFYKRGDASRNVRDKCKDCRKPYIQTGEGFSVAEDKEVYNSLDVEGQDFIDKHATALKFNLEKKIAGSELNKVGEPKTLNMGNDSARHVVLAFIRFISKLQG